MNELRFSRAPPIVFAPSPMARVFVRNRAISLDVTAVIVAHKRPFPLT